jgi:glycosyltransferase involved in cell wall biosynthesis
VSDAERLEAPSPAPPPLDIGVIIPALDEEASIGLVVAGLAREGAGRILVVDNGSRDRTIERARAAGAEVVEEARRGYGSACLRGLSHYATAPPDVVVFADGDYSDYPEDLTALLDPIREGRADFVVGSRLKGGAPKDALTPQARFGNWLSCTLIWRLFGVAYTDLGPFRAITWTALEQLGMGDRDFGWTVEMQVKAAKQGLRALEVPVRYRRRLGRSKISGTLSGSLRAGHKILWTIVRERWLTA